MKKRLYALLVIVVLCAALVSGCDNKQPAPTATAAPTATPAPVTLTVTGAWPDCRAIDEIARLFSAQYPNVTVEYEYLQDYYASLEKRLAADQTVDLFITSNIQESTSGSALKPYALNLYGLDGFSLADTFDGLIQNFMYRGDTEDGKSAMYAIPLGAEMRGLYVNKTLLSSLNIEVPTNQETLLAACETLKQNGYIPFGCNPGNFAQMLVYPWVCNLIANAADPAAAHAKVNAREAGLADMFAEPISFIYKLVEENYYDYKRGQSEFGLFLDTMDEAYARDFLNIVKSGEEYAKLDDVGRVAFMPSAMSLNSVIAKVKDDYHSEIDYVFIPAPVGTEGGFVYLSPSQGIAANKNSPDVEWSIKFLDFLFKPDNNRAFAKAFITIPNTKEAFSYIRSLYNTPDTRISHLGQVTFDYDFYAAFQSVIVDVSKANNPKYMTDDGAGNKTLTPLADFMTEMDQALTGK